MGHAPPSRPMPIRCGDSTTKTKTEPKKIIKKNDGFAESAAIGFFTNSGLLGGLFGDNLLGGMIGDLFNTRDK